MGVLQFSLICSTPHLPKFTPQDLRYASRNTTSALLPKLYGIPQLLRITHRPSTPHMHSQNKQIFTLLTAKIVLSDKPLLMAVHFLKFFLDT